MYMNYAVSYIDYILYKVSYKEKETHSHTFIRIDR